MKPTKSTKRKKAAAASAASGEPDGRAAEPSTVVRRRKTATGASATSASADLAASAPPQTALVDSPAAAEPTLDTATAASATDLGGANAPASARTLVGAPSSTQSMGALPDGDTDSTVIASAATVPVAGTATPPPEPPAALAARMFAGGVPRNEIGEFLGKNNDYNAQVLVEFVSLFDFGGMTIDLALR